MLNLLAQFFTLGTLGMVASAVGIGTSLYGAYNAHQASRNQGSSGGPTGYVPQGQPQADQAWQDMMRRFGGQANSDSDFLIPYNQEAFRANVGRNQTAMPMMDDYSRILAGEGRTAYGAASNLRDAGNAVWDAGRDPRNAIYNRNLQRTQDQSRAATSMRGIGMSPQAAGIENDAVSNFNMDWENQQLSRMLAALTGMGGAYDASGRQSQLGNSDLVGSSNMYNNATGLLFDPVNRYAGAMGSSVYSPWNALTGNYAQYMGLGQSGGQNAFNQGQTNLNNSTTAINQIGQGVGQGVDWLRNFFPPSPSGGGGPSGTPSDFITNYNPGNYG